MADGIDEPADQDEAAETDEAAVRELERLLLTHGPLTVEALAEHVAAELPELAAGLVGDGPDADDLVEELTYVTREADEFWRLPDGRLAPVLHHLRRATFTHRLTAAELEREAVDLNPDLVALALPRSVELAGGIELRTADAEDDARGASEGSVLGPPGWLAGSPLATVSPSATTVDRRSSSRSRTPTSTTRRDGR